MAVLKCKMCGGSLTAAEGESVCRCEYCGTSQTLPQTDNEKIRQLFDRANTFRLANDFDSAAAVYENIILEDHLNAEAHWGICLCRYGIEYVKDRRTGKRIPTCRRTQFRSILEDPDFAAAVRLSDSAAEAMYREEAAYINSVQKKILEISAAEEPYDIFICYKETDNFGNRTTDSVIAQDIYNTLTDKGYNVFFARITLETKIGREYEPYIFAALNSAKIMLVVGTDPDNFNAPWVRNEWSRYLGLIENGTGKLLIPCYRDMQPYELPDELKALQAQDVSKIGYMQDLVRGIDKILGERPGVKMQKSAPINPEALIERAAIFIEDGNWDSVNEYCEKALDANPRNAKAYLLRLMSDLKIRHVNDFMSIDTPFGDNYNYEKAVRFADPVMKDNLTKYELNARYLYAVALLEKSSSKNDLLVACEALRDVGSYKDALRLRVDAERRISGYEEEYLVEAKALINSPQHGNDILKARNLLTSAVETPETLELIKQCDDKLSSLYDEAFRNMKNAKTSAEYKKAYKQFEYLGDYRDSNSMEFVCAARYQEVFEAEEEMAEEEQRRAEAEAFEREIMQKAEETKKQEKRLTSRAFPLIALIMITAYFTFKLYDKVKLNGYIHPSLFPIMIISSSFCVLFMLLLEGLFNGQVHFTRWRPQKMAILFVTGMTTICSFTLEDIALYGGISIGAHLVAIVLGVILAKKIRSIDEE